MGTPLAGLDWDESLDLNIWGNALAKTDGFHEGWERTGVGRCVLCVWFCVGASEHPRDTPGSTPFPSWPLG
jgi:hypothetical protein